MLYPVGTDRQQAATRQPASQHVTLSSLSTWASWQHARTWLPGWATTAATRLAGGGGASASCYHNPQPAEAAQPLTEARWWTSPLQPGCSAGKMPGWFQDLCPHSLHVHTQSTTSRFCNAGQCHDACACDGYCCHMILRLSLTVYT